MTGCGRALDEATAEDPAQTAPSACRASTWARRSRTMRQGRRHGAPPARNTADRSGPALTPPALPIVSSGETVCRSHAVYRPLRPSARFSLSLPPWKPAMPMRRCEMKKVLGIHQQPRRPADDGRGRHSPRGVALAGLQSQRRTASHGATREQSATLATWCRTVKGEIIT
jgi:hypothetical protein